MPVYDFSPGLNLLNQGISTLGDALGNRTDAQAYAGIGDALSRGDYAGAATKAWQAGKPDTAMKLQEQAFRMGIAGNVGNYPSEGGAPGGAAAPAADGSTTAPDGTKAASLTPTKTTTSAGSPGNRWAPPGATANDVQNYIRQSAIARGIDPDTAVKVAHSEWGSSYTGDQGRSFGPFQLFTGGGLGNIAMKNGIDVTDPSTWKQQIDFALDHAASNGWGSWYGARNAGIPNNAGLANAKPIGVGRAQTAGGPSGAGGANVISAATPGEPAGPNLPAPGSLTPEAQPAAAAGQPTPTTGSLGANMLTAAKALQSGQVTIAQLQQNFGKYGLPDPKNPQSQPVWDNLSKVAGAGKQAGGVGQLNLPTVAGPGAGAVAAALPPDQGPAPGTPGAGKPGELGTPQPAAAAPPPTDLTEVGGQPGAVTPTSQAQVRQAIPALLPETPGYGDNPAARAGGQPSAPAPPAAPGQRTERDDAGRVPPGTVARDVPAVHSPAAVPAKLQPSSSSQGPYAPPPNVTSRGKPAQPVGPLTSFANDFGPGKGQMWGPRGTVMSAGGPGGVAGPDLSGARGTMPPGAPPIPPPITAQQMALARAGGGGREGGGGGQANYGPGPGAPAPGQPAPGGGNPITALLQRLGVGPQPGPGAAPAAMPGPGGQPPPPPQGGPPGGGAAPLQSLLGGLLNMGSMTPPQGVPGLPTPAQNLGYPSPGRPLGPPPVAAGGPQGAPAALTPGGPSVMPGGAPGAGGGAPPTLQQVQQQANAAVVQGSQYTDIPTLTRLRDQQRAIAQRMAIFSPDMAKPLEESASKLDDRINDLVKQQAGAGYEKQKIGETARSTQASKAIETLGTQYSLLSGTSGPDSMFRNINAAEQNLKTAAAGFGNSQNFWESTFSTLAPFIPELAGKAASTQEFKDRSTIELAQMAEQLFPKLNRNEIKLLKEGSFDLSQRPDVLYDMLELSRQRGLDLVKQHNATADRVAKVYPDVGGKEAAQLYHFDPDPASVKAPISKEEAVGGRAAGAGVTRKNPIILKPGDDPAKLPPRTFYTDGTTTYYSGDE